MKLPTGYHLGVSATTGDLSDNHDILSIKFYELDLPNDVRRGKQSVWSGELTRIVLAEQRRQVEHLAFGEIFRIAEGSCRGSETVFSFRSEGVPVDADRCHCDSRLRSHGDHVLSETAGEK